jgi:hypothetical protein
LLYFAESFPDNAPTTPPAAPAIKYPPIALCQLTLTFLDVGIREICEDPQLGQLAIIKIQ